MRLPAWRGMVRDVASDTRPTRSSGQAVVTTLSVRLLSIKRTMDNTADAPWATAVIWTFRVVTIRRDSHGRHLMVIDEWIQFCAQWE